ncbi:MAG: hypothetical protein WC099_00425 [Candidatus Paceibacterota bacterium]
MNNYESKKEISLYPSMLTWLQTYLEAKHPRASIKTYDVHSVDLSDFLQRNNYARFFPEYATYKIRVDLLGVMIEKEMCKLVFIEVKDTQLSLINLSQLLGYCKILKPDFAFLLSPKGLSKPLKQLLIHFNRLDILEFNKNRYIKVAKWNSSKNAIDNDSLIPPSGF